MEFELDINIFGQNEMFPGCATCCRSLRYIDMMIIHLTHCRRASTYGMKIEIAFQLQQSFIGRRKFSDRTKITYLNYVRKTDLRKTISNSTYLKTIDEINLRWNKSSFGIIRQILNKYTEIRYRIFHPEPFFNPQNLYSIMRQWAKSKHRGEIFRLVIENRPVYSHGFVKLCNFGAIELYKMARKLKNHAHYMKVLELWQDGMINVIVTNKEKVLIAEAKKFAAELN